MADAHEAAVAQSLVAKIVSSYVRKNRITPADVSALIDTVHQSLTALTTSADREPKLTPAVPIRRSVTRDYVICLECGWAGKTLRRHLQGSHRLTRDEYRARWGLPAKHPLTAPAYSEMRSNVAERTGLGRAVHKAARQQQQTPEPQVLIE
jgi:predicted transcriptional regulator